MATKAKTKTTAKKATNDTNFRVFYLSKSLKLAARATREKAQITQADQLTYAVETHLDKIVAGLAALGIEAAKQQGPVRLPMSEGLLKQLRTGSNASGVPMSALLAACLSLASQPAKKGGK